MSVLLPYHAPQQTSACVLLPHRPVPRLPSPPLHPSQKRVVLRVRAQGQPRCPGGRSARWVLAAGLVRKGGADGEGGGSSGNNLPFLKKGRKEKAARVKRCNFITNVSVGSCCRLGARGWSRWRGRMEFR